MNSERFLPTRPTRQWANNDDDEDRRPQLRLELRARETSAQGFLVRLPVRSEQVQIGKQVVVVEEAFVGSIEVVNTLRLGGSVRREQLAVAHDRVRRGRGEGRRRRAVPGKRDALRWGAIIAGFVTSLVSLLLLGLVGAAVGLSAMDTEAAAAGSTAPSSTNVALWAAASGVLSFLLGGYVAGRMGGWLAPRWGALHGALVFMLSVAVILWLSTQGLAAGLGALGNIGALRPDLAQSAASQAQGAASTAAPIDVARGAEAARNAIWGVLLGSLLGLGAAAMGGWLGSRARGARETESARIADGRNGRTDVSTEPSHTRRSDS